MKRIAIIAGLAALAASGCVERRMTILSDPPGATVFLDGEEIGKTPVTTGFTFYGGREIRLERDGYQTFAKVERIEPPYYEMFPFDLVAEVFVPWRIVDRRYFPYKLAPAEPVDRVALVERAKRYREEHKAFIARERTERHAAEMEQRQAERKKEEKEHLPRKKWYNLFF